MKLLAEFSHPAQVHKFKNVFAELRRRGVHILVLSRDKDVMLELLEQEGLPHRCISRARSGVFALALELLIRECRALVWALRFKPDIVLSAHSVAIMHVAWLLRIRRLAHEDTEFASVQQRLFLPFANVIITSTAYYLDWGRRQLRIPSIEPLAYLHPNYFNPDKERLSIYGLSPSTRYAVVRVVAWNAMHDRGCKGLDSVELEDMVLRLRAMGYEKIVITSESRLGARLPDSVIQPRAEDFHHLLARAHLCISESITVAGEAAVLGTPTILINPLRAGHTLELEAHQLIERSTGLDSALLAASRLSADKHAKQKWIHAKNKFLSSKSDMTADLTNIILRELQANSSQVS